MDKYRQAGSGQDIETLIQEIDRRIENLKIQFNLFFSGELDVPPEKEREELEKLVIKIQYSSHRSPRVNLLVQNAASRFNLYNNLWLKKLNEIETGMVTIKRKKQTHIEAAGQPRNVEHVFGLSLNREDSFESLYEKYCELTPQKTPPDKDRFINSLKTKMISSNLVDAKAAISLINGKTKIKLKK